EEFIGQFTRYGMSELGAAARYVLHATSAQRPSVAGIKVSGCIDLATWRSSLFLAHRATSFWRTATGIAPADAVWPLRRVNNLRECRLTISVGISLSDPHIDLI